MADLTVSHIEKQEEEDEDSKAFRAKQKADEAAKKALQQGLKDGKPMGERAGMCNRVFWSKLTVHALHCRSRHEKVSVQRMSCST